MSLTNDIDDAAAGKVEAPTKPGRGSDRFLTHPFETKTGPALSASGLKATGEHAAKEMAGAFWSGMENNVNAAAEIIGSGIPGPLNFLKAGMKVLLPNEVVENIFGVSKDFYKGIARGVIPEAKWPEAIKDPETEADFVKAYAPKKGAEGVLVDRYVGEIEKSPNALSKYLIDPMARGIGGLASQPVGGAGPSRVAATALERNIARIIPKQFGGPGSVGKNLILAAGAGEVGELGGEVGGGVGGAVGGERGKEIGRAIGQTAGAAVGGQANVMRVKGTGTVLERGLAATGSFRKALGAALSPEKGDTRDFFRRFTDEYKNFSTTTAGYFDAAVAEQYAEAIRNTPGAVENIKKFDQIAESVGIDRSKANLGQRTLVPSLVEKAAYFTPEGEAQATGKDIKTKALQNEIRKAYEGITGVSPSSNPNRLVVSLNKTRHRINTEIEARGREAMAVMDRSPKLNPVGVEKTGMDLKDAFETEQKEAQAFFMKQYNGLYRAADSAGVKVKVKDTTKAGLAKLMSVEVGMDPSVGYDLQHAIGVSQERLNSLTFKEAHDITKALGREANLAAVAKDSTKERLLSGYREMLLKDMQMATFGDGKTPGPAKYIWQQFSGINTAYRDKFVPRFETGINYNLDREGSRARKNLDYIQDSEVFGSSKGYLATVNGRVPEENMKQFDYAFGGVIEGTKKNQKAFDALGRALESEYSNQVYGPKDVKGRMEFNEDKHVKFMKDYEAAFNRVPQLAQKLHDQAAELMLLRGRDEVAAARWKAITKSPLEQTLPKAEVDLMVSKALTRPDKMARLIKAAGGKDTKVLYEDIMARYAPWRETSDGIVYDTDAFYKMLAAGAGPRGQGVSSIQLLARATYGTALGDKHIKNLKEIAAASLRESSTNPRVLGGEALVNRSSVESMTGQSFSSWVALGRNVETGRAGKAWGISQAVGRFTRQRFMRGLQMAEYKALFDPKFSDAIAELSKTPAGTPITAKTAKALADALGKDGKKLYDDLVNMGFVRSSMARGAALGLEQGGREEE